VLGRNDQCWCGSGIEYKKCHLLIESRQIPPAGKLINEALREFKLGLKCLCPLKHERTCSRKIVSAHSVQRTKALGPIKNENNKVMTFYETNGKGPKLLGWNQASTFKGFCEIHDKSIFAKVEDENIEPVPEKIFILGYRGFCHEYYQKSALLRVELNLINHLKGEPLKQKRMKEIYEGSKRLKLGTEHIKKEILDKALIAKKFEEFSSCYIHFEGIQVIAACGVLIPEFDVNRKRIRIPEYLVEQMSINLINEGESIIFVLFWPKEFRVCDIFANSLFALDEEALIRKIFALAFGYLENIFFSENWWSNLSDLQKYEISTLANNVYYNKSSPELSFKPADWKTKHIAKFGF
jgi:hypothetical protein